LYTENLIITITKDPGHFSTFALMMSKSDPWITLGMNLDQCLDAFKGEYKEIYFVGHPDDITGFVILQVCGTFSGYIQTIFIRDDYRGKGLGRMLLKFCEERIFQFSPNIFICVSSFNTGAMKLYYDFGFTLIGELDNFVKEGFTELLLRKTIGPRIGFRSH
jgi:[ribosomal protein S18]-alanine N-acetyltransferase